MLKNQLKMTAFLLVIILLTGCFPTNKQSTDGVSPPQTDIQSAEVLLHVSGRDPDPALTPGAPNPNISQGNIKETICNLNWSTSSIRPASSYTNKLKKQQIDQYEFQDHNLADYEEDHLISLELGGDPKDPKNLWPEAYEPNPGAHEKDKVENYLHKQICNGSLTLREAQQQIATNWYKVYLTISPNPSH